MPTSKSPHGGSSPTVSVNADNVFTSGRQVHAPEGTLKQTVDWFWSEINRLGHAPWGGEDHEIGAMFWETYSQALSGVAGAVNGIADTLDQLRRSLQTTGVTYHEEYFVQPDFRRPGG